MKIGFITLLIFLISNCLYSQLFYTIPYTSIDSHSIAIEYEYKIINGIINDSTISKILHFDNSGKLIDSYESYTLVYDSYSVTRVMSIRWYERFRYDYDEAQKVRYKIVGKIGDCDLKWINTLRFKKFRKNDRNMIAFHNCAKFTPNMISVEFIDEWYLDSEVKAIEYVNDSLTEIKGRLLASANKSKAEFCKNDYKINDTIIYEFCKRGIILRYKYCQNKLVEIYEVSTIGECTDKQINEANGFNPELIKFRYNTEGLLSEIERVFLGSSLINRVFYYKDEIEIKLK